MPAHVLSSVESASESDRRRLKRLQRELSDKGREERAHYREQLRAELADFKGDEHGINGRRKRHR